MRSEDANEPVEPDDTEQLVYYTMGLYRRAKRREMGFDLLDAQPGEAVVLGSWDVFPIDDIHLRVDQDFPDLVLIQYREKLIDIFDPRDFRSASDLATHMVVRTFQQAKKEGDLAEVEPDHGSDVGALDDIRVI